MTIILRTGDRLIRDLGDDRCEVIDAATGEVLSLEPQPLDRILRFGGHWEPVEKKKDPVAKTMASLPPGFGPKVAAHLETFGVTVAEGWDNLRALIEHAVARYEDMNTDDDWHAEPLPPWLTEDPALLDLLVEMTPTSAAWRWRPGAGDTLRETDRIASAFHDLLYNISLGFVVDQEIITAMFCVLSPGTTSWRALDATEDVLTAWARNLPLNEKVAVATNLALEHHYQAIAADHPRSVVRDYLEQVKPDSRLRDLPNHRVRAVALNAYKVEHEGRGIPGNGYENIAKAFALAAEEITPDEAILSPDLRGFFNALMDPFHEDLVYPNQAITDAFAGKHDADGGTFAYQGVPLGLRPLLSDLLRELHEEFGSVLSSIVPLETQEVIQAEWLRGNPHAGGEDLWGSDDEVG